MLRLRENLDIARLRARQRRVLALEGSRSVMGVGLDELVSMQRREAGDAECKLSRGTGAAFADDDLRGIDPQ